MYMLRMCQIRCLMLIESLSQILYLYVLHVHVYVHVLYMYISTFVYVHIDMYMYISICTCTYTYMYMYIRAGMKVGMFEPSLVCCAFEAKFLPLKLAATPTLMFAHVHVYNLNVWLIMWACSRKVEAVLLAAFVLFLSPAMPNLDRNTDRNNTNTRYKAIIQFWRLSIAN